MKQLLPLLFLACCSYLTAQPYTPVIINGEIFYKVELEMAEGLVISEVTVGDFDVLDDLVYQRVFLKRGLNKDILIGHTRENPAIGQIVYRPLGGSDQLVYDISLSVGESIDLNARWCDGLEGNTATVVAEEEDEDGRKVLVFDRRVGESDICDTLRFTEGLGPNAGLIMPHLAEADLSEGVALRICHVARGGVIFYPMDAVFDLCGVPTTDTDEAPGINYRIYPNPFRDRLFVPETTPDDGLQLYSLTGRLLGEWQGKTEVEVSGLPSGIYLLQITRNGQVIDRRRVVKW